MWGPPMPRCWLRPSARFAEQAGIDIADIGFSEFTKGGFWDVDDVLRPIFEEASEALGRDFPYPGDE